jgi:hypothetical protein
MAEDKNRPRKPPEGGGGPAQGVASRLQTGGGDTGALKRGGR